MLKGWFKELFKKKKYFPIMIKLILHRINYAVHYKVLSATRFSTFQTTKKYVLSGYLNFI